MQKKGIELQKFRKKTTAAQLQRARIPGFFLPRSLDLVACMFAHAAFFKDMFPPDFLALIQVSYRQIILIAHETCAASL